MSRPGVLLLPCAQVRASNNLGRSYHATLRWMAGTTIPGILEDERAVLCEKLRSGPLARPLL
jgi:hypothetical protein